MYDIILINPPILNQSYGSYDINKRAPVGLLSIGSVLSREGYRVRVIDGVIDSDYLKKLRSAGNGNVLFYGITCMTAQLPSALEIAGVLRAIAPGKPIVWGGVHPTLFPEQTCSSDLVDVVVIGEGEHTALELANSLKEGLPYTSIDGIAFRDNGRVRITEIREVRPLDELPFPDYEILDVDRYLLKNINAVGPQCIKKSMVVYAAIGCPFNCAFCINTVLARKLHREKYRARSAEKVLEVIDYLVHRYGVEDIYFQDELFFAGKPRLLQIVDGILERRYDISWAANVYAGFFRDDYLSEEVFAKVARSGCHRLTMGVESGCERVLKILQKKIDLDLVERSAYLSRKYGVTMGYSFMMGVPGETKREVMQTLQFIRKLYRINPNNYVIGPQLFRPYPGCDFYTVWKESGGEEPCTLKAWGEKLSTEGSPYVTVKDLPWLGTENYDFFFTLNTVGVRYLMPIKNVSRSGKGLLKLCYVPLFRLRYKLNFWRYPVEMKLLHFVRSLRKGIKRSAPQVT